MTQDEDVSEEDGGMNRREGDDSKSRRRVVKSCREL
jgi:hypothetical protein